MLRSYFLTNELFPRHALKGDRVEISLAFCALFLEGVQNTVSKKSPNTQGGDQAAFGSISVRNRIGKTAGPKE